MTRSLAAIASLFLACTALLPGCAAPRPVEALARSGQEIVVCGLLIPIGAPVVLWTDAGGYDAYQTQPRFARPGRDESADVPARNRYGDRPRPDHAVGGEGPAPWTIPELARVVDQFVVHYDAAGTSRECFRILHDVRHLSVHFLLDLDGTIYQTLDVQERAWHATIANDRSIGIEIAQIGAYPPGAGGASPGALERWYARDEAGWRIALPAHLGDGGLRTPGFIARPASDGPIFGVVNGHELVQHDFTPQQYESLARLLGALNGALPGITLDAPRGIDGRMLDRTLSAEEFAGFRGVLGHWHVQENKVDPGPAFDWERVLGRARELR